MATRTPAQRTQGGPDMETRGKKAAGPGCGASPGGKNPVPGGGRRVDGRPTATKHRRQRAGQRVGKMGLNSWPVQRRSRTKTSSPVSATARLLLEHPCRCGLPQVGCAGSAARRDEEIPRAESTRNGAAMRRSICGTPELGCGSSVLGFCGDEESDELELDDRRPARGSQLHSGEQTAKLAPAPRYFLSHISS